MNRRLVKLGVAALLLLAAGGHVWYWYWPRERPGTADATDPALLFALGPFDACFWIPYPHQNLGALASAVGDWPGFLGAMARLGELPSPDLPSFGPFAVPPSREAVVCSDLEGGRLVVMARVYPALGLVARTAGRLAGNPWLAGGEIADPERPVRVEWRDGLWTVAFAGASVDVDRSLTVAPLPAALAAIRLGRRFSRFPTGTYLLRRDERGLELGLHEQRPPRRPPPDFGAEPPPALLAATESADLARSDAPTAVAIFATAPEPLAPLGLPGAAVFFRHGGARWDLPGEGLFGLLQGALPKGNAGGWRIVALDGDSLRRAERLAPGLGATVGAVGAGSSDRLLLGLWVQPAEARQLVARLRGRLEKVPLTGRHRIRRLADWEIVLAPLERCDELSLVATEEPAGFRMRLDGC